MQLYFLLGAGDKVPELPFESRIIRAYAYDEDDGNGSYKHIGATTVGDGVNARIVEVDLPKPKDRTPEQYQQYKDAISYLHQVYDPKF